MDDYFLKIQELKEDDLFEEIKKLNTKLYSVNETSPMFQQLKSMLDMCNERQKDIMMEYRLKSDKTPDVLEIGEIESVVYTPEYSEQELLTTLTNFYSENKETKKLSVPQKTQQQTVQPKTQYSTPGPFTIDVPKFGAKK